MIIYWTLSSYCMLMCMLCNVVICQQHLYSIHLADQPEDCTMQLADHIKVRVSVALSEKGSPASRLFLYLSCLFCSLINIPLCFVVHSERPGLHGCGGGPPACLPSPWTGRGRVYCPVEGPGDFLFWREAVLQEDPPPYARHRRPRYPIGPQLWPTGTVISLVWILNLESELRFSDEN